MTMRVIAPRGGQGVAPRRLAVLSSLPAQLPSSHHVQRSDNTASGPEPCRLLPATLPCGTNASYPRVRGEALATALAETANRPAMDRRVSASAIA
jgi:hypothetical protein